MEAKQIDRPDRVRADPEESPVQFLGDLPVYLQIEAGGLRLHRREVPGQERVVCRRRQRSARLIHGRLPVEFLDVRRVNAAVAARDGGGLVRESAHLFLLC